MSDETGLGDRDEPASGTDDHAELLSELDSHDLATAMSVRRATAADPFTVDDSADPETVFPKSVASGGPKPSGVILWTRIDPDRFDPEAPLGVQIATDDVFEDVVYDGVVNLDDVTDEYREE